jgi:hypothetical protein
MEVRECQCDCDCNAFLDVAGMDAKIFRDPILGFIAVCGACFEELDAEQDEDRDDWDLQIYTT